MAIIFVLAALAGAWITVRFAITYRQFIPQYFGAMVLLPTVKIAIVASTGVGMLCGWRWSRWAAVFLLMVWIAFAVRNEMTGAMPTSVADALGIDRTAVGYRAGRAMATLCFSALTIGVAGLIAFSKSSRDYFSRR